ncbi:CDP-glycerol glycerophosphotransferase family protein [Microbacterium sp. C7(2022)]|uniref:CDP-glycerol glycerophosphotransferase family protein n=1 Tax=Microbacterium sp. C7(2022) TaxID=2992759 RepID=UPI00237BC0BF|nr:CDP-glycerol glycerophosphotransferase family protein [Microbacterium sp. C7(2022)]MDE0545669.1 CDP-glycerol glycerophosphotransferase family protein [Microbacterium sp. C7(2022)]
MASFSFGAGNARKLLSIPLYALGRMATWVIPRTREDWVFGCAVGLADGALALWEVAARHGVPAVWLVDSDEQARDAAARGIPSIHKHSARGFWRTARARVVVLTHGFGDVNRFAASGAVIVQLWHGIPLKRIGIDSPETTRAPHTVRGTWLGGATEMLLRAMYRSATRRITVIPAASELVRGRLESAFSLRSSAVPVTGEPRVDVLSQGDVEARQARARATIEAAVGALGGARVVLYAPTWRDGDEDPAIPKAEDWREILATLERVDAVLLVRSHPLGAGEYQPGSSTDRVRLLGSDRLVDITPALSGIDALITDYSSLAFDASLVPVPTIFFAPDVESYAARRGFYGEYRDVAGNAWAQSWTQTLDQLTGLLSDEGERTRRIARARALSDSVHAYSDGRNSERLYEAIAARIGALPGRAQLRRTR